MNSTRIATNTRSRSKLELGNKNRALHELTTSTHTNETIHEVPTTDAGPSQNLVIKWRRELYCKACHYTTLRKRKKK